MKWGEHCCIVTTCHVTSFSLAIVSADAVNNAAGYGFLGMDENGKPSWDLICNINILGIEVPWVFPIIPQCMVTLYCTQFHAEVRRWLNDPTHTVIVVGFFFRLQPASRHLLTTGIFEQESGSRRKCRQCELNHTQRKHVLRLDWLCFACRCTRLIALISFRVCYDRAPKHRLALTFILSALWHGVYPGYYFTFITAIPITIAARAVSTRGHLVCSDESAFHKWKKKHSTNKVWTASEISVLLEGLEWFLSPLKLWSGLFLYTRQL